MPSNSFYLVGKMADGTFCVYQCKGRMGHDGGPIIASCASEDAAGRIASALNNAGVVYDLTSALPQFKIGR